MSFHVSHHPTLQVCRNCGGGAPVDVHFCPQCTKILSLGRHGDYFAFLGVPRRLDLDAADLERRFRDAEPAVPSRLLLQRDAGRAPREPRAVVVSERRLPDAASSRSRASSTCSSSKGLAARRAAGRGAPKQVPPALLEEVFALNEELDEVRELRAGGAPRRGVARAARARARRRSRRSARRTRRELARAVGALGRAASIAARADGERREVLDGAARPRARAQLHQQPARRHRAGAERADRRTPGAR